MPRFICKFDTPEGARYLEWSTVVDAPVTFGMPLDEFKEHYKKQYGLEGMCGLRDRLDRADAKGASSRIHDSLDEVISYNRAGKNGTQFTKEQIVEWYCIKREDPEVEGTKHE